VTESVKKGAASNQTPKEMEVEERLSKKRMEQHQQWMRVMMDGQSTPDNRYKKQG